MKKLNWIVFFVLIFFAHNAVAQQPFPYWKDVQKFKQQDSIAFPESNQILFIGSSSFTKWKDVNDYFPGYKILNRAFGGSRLVDLIRYRYEVIYPYNPRQIVIYCGENDFAAKDNPSVDEVMERFNTLYKLIRSKYPTVPLAYVAMKPSPSREHLLPKFSEANKRIKQLLAQDKNAAFIDVYPLMFNKDGSIMKDIFVEDNLHMNAKGYAIWQKAIKPYLKKPAR